MSRQCEKCCDILSDVHANLCRDNEKKKFATKTFLPIPESKVDYLATQRKYVVTQKKFDAQGNLCCDIQKYCRNNVFLFQKHRSFTILSRHRESVSRQTFLRLR